MAFEWHAAKAQSNLDKHGVSFEEAQTVFDDAGQLHFPDRAHSIEEERFICLGLSNQGRALMLSYTEPQADTIRIISSREMTPKERKTYATRNQNS